MVIAVLEPNENHMLCVVDDKTGELGDELCEEVFVEAEHIDLSTNSWMAHIAMWKNGEKITFQLNRKHLDNQVLPDLLDKGFTLLDDPENIAATLGYILDSDKSAPIIYKHRKLGFCEVNEKMVFLADEVIGECSKQSHYFKPQITAPRGTLDTWKAIVEQEVIGHPNMELALAIGASAPVAHLLQEAKLMAEVPIWGLIGPSSTGKTSCARVMASIYGAPEEGSGLIKNFNASDNAIFAMLQDSGIVHLIDESTIAGKKNFSSMIYKLSTGIDRLRCNTDGTLKEQQTFTGSVVITGEQSLLEQSSANLGLYARVVELTLPWTDDADHARRISQGVRKNYGTAIVPYAECLLKLQKRPDILEKAFNQELQRFRDKLGNISGVEERLLNSYVTVTLAARLFNKALEPKLDVPAIRKLLVEVHPKAPRVGELARELYDTVMDKAGLHGAYFPKTGGKHKNLVIPANMWGEYTKRGKRDALWISGIKFREFTEEKFINPKPYLHELHNQGLVERFSDGFTCKHTLGHSEVRCYCFYLT